MKYRTLVLAIALLLVAALACGGSDETVAPTQPPPPPTTAPPTQPTQPPPPPTTAPPTQPTQPSPIGSGGLDFGLEPTFGEVDLEAGFLPDPYVVPLVSGGSVDVDALD
ncbi:MAG: hypothetical protein JW900_15505, partial [Anaerolineae bacterium]|nr:hypothetical protein [Anaerolineae bacterium]